MSTPIPLTPVVFLPGLLCDAVFWRACVDGLADRVAPAVADLTLDDSVSAMAARTLAAAPSRFALVGLSMGGYVAFEILRQAPERVTHLALMCTSAGPDSPERAAERRAGILGLAAAGGHGHFRGVTDQLLPRLVHPDHVDGPVGEAVKDMATRVGSKAFVRQQTAILNRPDSRSDLAHLRLPTLFVAGADDRLSPPTVVREMHEAVPGSAFHVVPTCGHLPPLEQPAVTVELLRAWLEPAPAT